jgi:hypothetical protein
MSGVDAGIGVGLGVTQAALSPVDTALLRLANEVDGLIGAVTDHEIRLAPVSSPIESPPSPMGDDYPGGSAVVQAISRATEAVTLLSRRIRNLTSALEV